MRARYLPLWGISLLAMLTPRQSHAAEFALVFHGRVSVGQSAAKGACISVLEGHLSRKAFNLPDFLPVAHGSTGTNGEFTIKTKPLRAAIIEVKGSRCRWHSRRIVVDREILKKGGLVSLEIRLYPDINCSEP